MGENLAITSNNYLSLYLKIIKEKFSKYNLSLEHVKWKGTFLSGSEADIRLFFVQLILKIIIESEFSTFDKNIYLNPILKTYIDDLIPENTRFKISALVPSFTKLLKLNLAFYEIKALEAIFFFLFIKKKNILLCEEPIIFFQIFGKEEEKFNKIYSTLKKSSLFNNFPYLKNNILYISLSILNLHKEVPYWKKSGYHDLVKKLESYFNVTFSQNDNILFLNIFECAIFKKDFEIYNFNNYTCQSNTNIVTLVAFFKKFFLKYNLNFLEDDYFKISLFFYYQILQKKLFSFNWKIAIIDLSFDNWIGNNLKVNLEKNLKLSTIEVINFHSEKLNTNYLSEFDCIFFTHQVDLNIFFKNHSNIQETQGKCHFVDYSNFFRIEEFLFNAVFLNDLDLYLNLD